MGDRVLLVRLLAELVLDCKMAVVEMFAVVVLAARLTGATVPGRSMGRLRIRCLVLNRNRARLEFLLRFRHQERCFVVAATST